MQINTDFYHDFVHQKMRVPTVVGLETSMIKTLLPLLIIIVFAPMNSLAQGLERVTSVRKIAFTFDDGDTTSYPNNTLEVWNARLLNSLEKHGVKAILYSAGRGMNNPKGGEILRSWDSKGHYIANHSFSHKNYSHPKATFSWFREDFLKNDSIVSRYANFIKYYRFPYLKEGNTREKIDSVRWFFKQQGYGFGHVTIDASDWYINSRLIDRMKKDSMVNLEAYKAFYIEHLYERAMFYDSLAYALHRRHINHSLLLHHNLIASLFLDELITFFKAKGWEIIDAKEALNDDVYSYQSSLVPCGESIIWSMAKEKGGYDSILRYPAEDSQYEKPKMDSLGL